MSFYKHTTHTGIVGITCLGILVVVAAMLAVVPLIIMVCWNALFPAQTINFIQAFAAWVLISIAGSAFKSVTHKS